MKVFKKVFALAVIASAFAISASAFAATIDGTTISVPSSELPAITGQTAVAVVDETFGETNANGNLVYYIDQDDAANVLADVATGLTLGNGAVADSANYQVRIGNATLATPFVSTIAKATVEYDEPIAQDNAVGIKTTLDVKVGGKAVTGVSFNLTAQNGESTKPGTYSLQKESLLDIIKAATGTVNFGLEIQGVPEGVTITVNSVDVTYAE